MVIFFGHQGYIFFAVVRAVVGVVHQSVVVSRHEAVGVRRGEFFTVLPCVG